MVKFSIYLNRRVFLMTRYEWINVPVYRDNTVVHFSFKVNLLMFVVVAVGSTCVRAGTNGNGERHIKESAPTYVPQSKSMPLIT